MRKFYTFWIFTLMLIGSALSAAAGQVSIYITNGADQISFLYFNKSGNMIEGYTDGKIINYTYDDKDTELQIWRAHKNELFETVNYRVGRSGDQIDAELDTFADYYIIPLEGATETIYVSIQYYKTGEVPDPVEKSTISLEYADETTKKAMQMIYNNVSGGIYSGTGELPTSYEVEKNASYSDNHTNFTWDAGYDMKIQIDGKDYTPSATPNKLGEQTISYTWQCPGADMSDFNSEDHTIRFSATEHDYGIVWLTFSCRNEDGLVLRDGAEDGEIIEFSKWVLLSTDSDGKKTYRAPTDGRNPVIYVSAKEGWTLTGSYYVNKTIDGGTVEEPSSIISPAFNFTDYYYEPVMQAANNPYIIYVGTYEPLTFVGFTKNNTTLYNFMKDSEGKAMVLSRGYNEVFIDTSLLQSIRVSTSDLSKISCYYDNEEIEKTDAAFFSIPCEENGVLHVFDSANVPEKYNLSLNIEDSTTKVTFHKRKAHDGSDSYSAFHGTLVTINPRYGCVVYLDDEQLAPLPKTRSYEPVLSNDVYEFYATDDHKVDVKYEGRANLMEMTPLDDMTLESLPYFRVSFPDAEHAEPMASPTEDDFLVTGPGNWTATADDVEINQESKASAPTFKITFKNAPTETGDYTINLAKGFFVVEGDLKSTAAKATVHLDIASAVTEITDGTADGAPIYNLQGIEVGNDLDSLPAGVYIRDGKKILKK